MYYFFLLCTILLFPLTAQAGQPFAVVELFTSEGCSSCPPADQVLIQINDEAEKQNLPIYTLGFHVDYWDRLGWKDRFSQNLFTQRQYLYAQKFNSSSVYTPQMVINGQLELNGSNQTKAWNLIQEELNKESNLEIHAYLEQIKNTQYKLTYNLNQVPENAYINIAIVERNLSSEVRSGENSGKTLNHINVVRYFNSSALKRSKAQALINISTDWNIKDLSIMVYVQNAKTMQILGVNQISNF